VGSLIGAGSILAAGGAVAAAGARVVSAGVTRATSLAGRGIETLSAAALPREGTGPSDPDPPSGGPPSDGPLGPGPVAGGAAPGGGQVNPGSPSATVDSDQSAPAWAREQARREQLRGAINAGAQTIRSSDHGASGPHPDLTEEE
jgi:hypothetical protein